MDSTQTLSTCSVPTPSQCRVHIEDVGTGRTVTLAEFQEAISDQIAGIVSNAGAFAQQVAVLAEFLAVIQRFVPSSEIQKRGDEIAITVDEAARRSSLSRALLYLEIDEGRLFAHKRRGRTYILVDELRDYLAAGPRVGGPNKVK